ncbi:MAG: hypothetical protein Q9216_000641 [Gyalolechia sp. 2 TL-2023]
MAPNVRLLTALSLVFLAHSTLAVDCYSRNEISAADSSISNRTASLLVACNAAADSACCFSYETCAPDLLCHSSDGSVRRQYCTDPTWQTNQCSSLCPQYDEAGTILTQCTDGSYCCGFDNFECCDKDEGTRINKSNGQIIISGQISRSIAAATSTISSSATQETSSSRPTTNIPPAAASGASTSSSLPSPSAVSESDDGLSGGAKAGIAIGAVAGVALVAGLLFLLYRERRKRRALQGMQGGMHQGEMQQGGMPGPKYPWQTVPGAPIEHYAPQEMDVSEHQGAKYQYRGEMDGQARPHELPVASPRT